MVDRFDLYALTPDQLRLAIQSAESCVSNSYRDGTSLLNAVKLLTMLQQHMEGLARARGQATTAAFARGEWP